MFLLDANVLIALGDATHVHGDAAVRFFENEVVRTSWATCPITENAFLRILGNPNYANGPGSAEGARKLLKRLVAAPGHQFWPDDFSLTDARPFPVLPAPKHLTDHYLLALAASRQARLATFDRNIDPALVPGGHSALFLIS